MKTFKKVLEWTLFGCLLAAFLVLSWLVIEWASPIILYMKGFR